jgi:hypothetical protein
MLRTLKWMESHNFQGFGCSQCKWKFSPSGVPMGQSLDEMKQKYEADRDKEFAAHVCVKDQRSKAKDSIGRIGHYGVDRQAKPSN